MKIGCAIFTVRLRSSPFRGCLQNELSLMKSRFALCVGMIGNFLEHYDSVLFALLAPFLAPLFFHEKDPITALLFTYAMLPLGVLAKPLGALYFGWMGDCIGRQKAFSVSLVGMALATMALGCLPLSREVGVLAPLLLALVRLLQSFFSAGETPNGALYILEAGGSKHFSLLSGLFDASSVAGALFASALVALGSSLGWIERGWRYFFIAGSISAFFGVAARVALREGGALAIGACRKFEIRRFWLSFCEHRRAFLALFLAAGLSHTVYSFTFTLMNGYIPLITSISKTQLMQMNTALLVADFILLPVFGYLAQKVGKERVMLFASAALILGAWPVFGLLGVHATLMDVAIVRLFLMTAGIAFAAPYYAWAVEQVPSLSRGAIFSFAYTLGAQVLGSPAAAISIWIYQQTKWTAAPMLYLMPVALGAWIVIARKSVFIPKPVHLKSTQE